MKFFLIAGNCGSGKTYLAKLIQAKLGGYLIDDPKTIDELNKIPPNEKFVYVTDPNFCLPKVRYKVEKHLHTLFPESNIEWIFIEINAEQSRKNVEARNDGRKVEGSIRRYSAEGIYPIDAIIYPCYSPEIHKLFLQIADNLVGENQC